MELESLAPEGNDLFLDDPSQLWFTESGVWIFSLVRLCLYLSSQPLAVLLSFVEVVPYSRPCLLLRMSYAKLNQTSHKCIRQAFCSSKGQWGYHMSLLCAWRKDTGWQASHPCGAPCWGHRPIFPEWTKLHDNHCQRPSCLSRAVLSLTSQLPSLYSVTHAP